MLQLLLTAYDSMGNDMLAEHSSSSSSEHHTDEEDTSECTSPKTQKQHQLRGDADLQQYSQAEMVSCRGSTHTSLDEETDVQPSSSSGQKLKSKKIAARRQLPPTAPLDPAQLQRSTIVHFLEQVAEGSTIDPQLALAQVRHSCCVKMLPPLTRSSFVSPSACLLQGVKVSQWEEEGRREVTVGRDLEGRLLAVAVADTSSKSVLTSVDVSSTTNLLELCKAKPPDSSLAGHYAAAYIIQEQGRFVQVIDRGPDAGGVHCTDVTDNLAQCLHYYEEGGHCKGSTIPNHSRSKPMPSSTCPMCEADATALDAMAAEALLALQALPVASHFFVKHYRGSKTSYRLIHGYHALSCAES